MGIAVLLQGKVDNAAETANSPCIFDAFRVTSLRHQFAVESMTAVAAQNALPDRRSVLPVLLHDLQMLDGICPWDP